MILIYLHHVPIIKICRQCTATINTVVYSDSFHFSSSSSAITKMLYGGAGMFGYNPTTSIVHKIIPSGNFGRERCFLEIW